MPEVVTRKLKAAAKSTSPRTVDSSELPVTGLRLHAACIVLVLLAAGIFTLTEHDDHQHSLWCIFEIAMQSVLVILGTIYFRKRIVVLKNSSVVSPMLVMVACLSLICEPIQRVLFNTGHSFETLIMHCQCNLMLALAVCGFRMSYQRLACIIAIFMTIFCGTISNAQGLVPLIGLFTIAAIVWLVTAWWETVDCRRLQSDETRVPKTWLAAAIALPVLAVATASSFGSSTITTALRGFMPSSGGTEWYDPNSRGGVNDGDALIAGNEDIKSFAPLEDAPFVESDQPSLYDVFNDTYDEPAKKVKNQQRAIALPPELMKHIHQEMAESKQAGREFSLIRSEKEASDDRIRDLQSTALFYVAGRTPVHFKTEVYELFDGLSWMPGLRESVVPVLHETDGRHWLHLPRNKSFEVFSGNETHSIKVANLGGNVIPTPTNPIGVSIDKVNRADIYEVSSSGVIGLSRESLPSMTPISVVSQCIDEQLLRDNKAVSNLRRKTVRSLNDVFVMLPEGEDTTRIHQLAKQLTFGQPRGWKQIEAIRDHLRENFVLDRETHISEDSDSPVADFLFETKRGPEYLFASAAAVMLRTLGYSTRMASGFYARPDKYDVRKKHTLVHGADTHFWCEVSIGAAIWMTVEASPGYHTLQPRPGLMARLLAFLGECWQMVKANAIALALCSLTCLALFCCRRFVQDTLLTLRWRVFSAKSDRKAVQLASLIDQRLRLVGIERKPGTTLKRWSRKEELQPVQDSLHRIADIADRVMFDQHAEEHFDDAELQRLERRLSYRQLKELTRSHTKMQAV